MGGRQGFDLRRALRRTGFAGMAVVLVAALTPAQTVQGSTLGDSEALQVLADDPRSRLEPTVDGPTAAAGQSQAMVDSAAIDGVGDVAPTTVTASVVANTELDASGSIQLEIGFAGPYKGPGGSDDPPQDFERRAPYVVPFVDVRPAGNPTDAAPGRLSALEIYAVARAAGFDRPDGITMTAIALAESGGNPIAHNGRGEDSWGLWQINRDAHPWTYVIDLTDPLVNGQAAYRISRAGQTVVPWTVTHVSRGAPYLRYLAVAAAAADAHDAGETTVDRDGADPRDDDDRTSRENRRNRARDQQAERREETETRPQPKPKPKPEVQVEVVDVIVAGPELPAGEDQESDTDEVALPELPVTNGVPVDVPVKQAPQPALEPEVKVDFDIDPKPQPDPEVKVDFDFDIEPKPQPDPEVNVDFDIEPKQQLDPEVKVDLDLDPKPGEAEEPPPAPVETDGWDATLPDGMVVSCRVRGDVVDPTTRCQELLAMWTEWIAKQQPSGDDSTAAPGNDAPDPAEMTMVACEVSRAVQSVPGTAMALVLGLAADKVDAADAAEKQAVPPEELARRATRLEDMLDRCEAALDAPPGDAGSGTPALLVITRD